MSRDEARRAGTLPTDGGCAAVFEEMVCQYSAPVQLSHVSSFETSQADGRRLTFSFTRAQPLGRTVRRCSTTAPTSSPSWRPRPRRPCPTRRSRGRADCRASRRMRARGCPAGGISADQRARCSCVSASSAKELMPLVRLLTSVAALLCFPETEVRDGALGRGDRPPAVARRLQEPVPILQAAADRGEPGERPLVGRGRAGAVKMERGADLSASNSFPNPALAVFSASNGRGWRPLRSNVRRPTSSIDADFGV
jgi:hypothetical protein